MKIDELIEKTLEKKCPVCVGLDTMADYVPKALFGKVVNKPLKYAADAVLKFNRGIIDAVHDLVPCVKVQAACYEMYGAEGMRVFDLTMKYARKKGLIVIADVKRNDIGPTAAAYAAAYLSGVKVMDSVQNGFDADFITINPYLGTDGVKPFLDACEKTGKGLFCLVKTSNPSSAEFQDVYTEGEKLYDKVAKKVQEWGKNLTGKYGYSSVGAVVGATYPKEAEFLRNMFPYVYFLVPGYGAQGAGADDIAVNFDGSGVGAVINSSRAILLAYKNEKYKRMDFMKAARQAVFDMKEDILFALYKRGVKYQ